LETRGTIRIAVAAQGAGRVAAPQRDADRRRITAGRLAARPQAGGALGPGGGGGGGGPAARPPPGGARGGGGRGGRRAGGRGGGGCGRWTGCGPVRTGGSS